MRSESRKRRQEKQMLRTLKSVMRQDREKFKIPRSVQQAIPIQRIWKDGIFQVGRNKFAKTYRFTDINFEVLSEDDKKAKFLNYMSILNFFDCGATAKLTVIIRRLNKEELKEATNSLRILGVKLEKEEEFLLGDTGNERMIFLIKKEEKTPEKYPRKAGIPTKQPL